MSQISLSQIRESVHSRHLFSHRVPACPSMVHKKCKAVVQFWTLTEARVCISLQCTWKALDCLQAHSASPELVCSQVCSSPFPCSASSISWRMQAVCTRLPCLLLFNWVQPIGIQMVVVGGHPPHTVWFQFPLVTLGSGYTISFLWPSGLRVLMTSCSR